MKNNNHKDQLFCSCSGGKDRRSVVVVNSKESDRRCLAEWKKKISWTGGSEQLNP